MIAIVAIVAFKMNQKQVSKISSLTLANVEALADDSESSKKPKKCKQLERYYSYEEVCSYTPISFITYNGIMYSLEKDEDGTQTSGKSGFEGIRINECAANPNDEKQNVKAAIVNC